MWFLQGQHNENDRFRVSSIRNRIRRRKSTSKSLSSDTASSDTTDNSTNSLCVNTAASTNSKDENFGIKMNTVLRSPSGRRLSIISSIHDKKLEKEIEKEKVLLTDRKFKKNRVMKSSSKSKMTDLTDKQNIAKNQCGCGSARKISSPSMQDGKLIPLAKQKNIRPNSNLNLNALLRYKSFISSSTKKLTHEDFDRLRRKSITEPAKLGRKLSAENATKLSEHDETYDIRVNRESSDRMTDEEIFHSCNEDDSNVGGAAEILRSDLKISSPSLTARVAARFTEGVQKAKKKSKRERRKGSYCPPEG